MTEEFDQPSQKNPEKLIMGTWDWKYTIYDHRGARPPNNRTTPESEGHTEQLRFLENGQVETHRDGELTETQPYSIEIYGDARIPGIRLSYSVYIGQKKQEFEVTADTLEISPMGFGNCGWSVVYSRVESITVSDA
jgi:hypothetical protein